jgi:RNA polymerase sigma factor (sigma-70 family)
MKPVLFSFASGESNFSMLPFLPGGNLFDTMKDQELLRAFVNTGDQEAFAELVRRNMALVYGSALRRVRDPDLAQEISQETFCALLKAAKSIRHPAALAGWLYRTTANIARMRLRSEQRRRKREEIAAQAMNDSNAPIETNWEGISELLEPALEQLPEPDRLAILMRYLQSKPLAQVAVALGINEAAAKMRVCRAVEKLRTYLGVKNASLTAPALALLLEQNASQAAPCTALEEVMKASGFYFRIRARKEGYATKIASWSRFQHDHPTGENGAFSWDSAPNDGGVPQGGRAEGENCAAFAQGDDGDLSWLGKLGTRRSASLPFLGRDAVPRVPFTSAAEPIYSRALAFIRG